MSSAHHTNPEDETRVRSVYPDASLEKNGNRFYVYASFTSNVVLGIGLTMGEAWLDAREVMVIAGEHLPVPVAPWFHRVFSVGQA